MDPVTRRHLNPFAAPIYAAAFTPPNQTSLSARKAAIKKAIRRGNQILLKEFGIEAEHLEMNLLNRTDLTDIGNALGREVVLFKEVEIGREYEFLLRTQLLYDDDVILVKCLDGNIAHSRSVQFCLQQFNCAFCQAIYASQAAYSKHVTHCKFKGGFLTNIDSHLQTTVYKTGRRRRLVRRSIDEELEEAGIRLIHPKNFFFRTQVLACDCETMLQPIEEGAYFLASREHTQTAKNARSYHSLIMFGSFSNIEGLERFTCIERDFSDPDQMAVDILNHWYQVAAVAEDLERQKFEYYFTRIRQIQETINPNSPYHKMLANLTKKLDAYCSKLSIVFFNLAYDQHILLRAGVFALMLTRDRLDDPLAKLQFHAVKGRTISIKSRNFHILDLMSYLPARASLKTVYENFFGKDDNDLNKQIMAYQYLDKPEKLDNTVESLVLDDFNDDLHGVNGLQEPAAKYLDTLELCDFDEGRTLAKLYLSEPPPLGEQRLRDLKQMLADKGIKTIRQMLRNYLEYDVRPFCQLIGKILDGWFRVLNNDILQHYPTLPSLAFESALRHNDTYLRIPLFSLDIDTARLFETASGGLSGGVADVGGQRLAIVPEGDDVMEDETDQEFRCGRYIAENWFGRNAARIRSLHAFDINSCYGSILAQKLPFGQYRVRREENNGYEAEHYGVREHVAYVWLQFESMLLGHTLRTKWTNPGEQQIVLEDKDTGKAVRYRLDGYHKLETSPYVYEQYGYEYNECHSTRNRTEYNGLFLGNNSSHGICDSCKLQWQQESKPIPEYLVKKRRETDKRLENLLEAGLYMKTIWSCTAIKILDGEQLEVEEDNIVIDSEDNPEYRAAFRHFFANFDGYSFPIAQRRYSSKEDIIEDVISERIGTGWMLVDAHVPRRHRLDFFDLPPLYAKRLVTPEDVGPVTMEYLAQSNAKLSKEPLLVGTFTVTKYLMNFETVHQLIKEVDLCITKIYLFIEFESNAIFADYVAKIFGGRIKAKLNNDALESEIFKALLNQFFGKVDTDGMVVAFGTTDFRDSCKPTMRESYNTTIDSLLENEQTKNTIKSLGLFKEERLRRCVMLTTKGYAAQPWVAMAPDTVRFRGISSKHYENWRQLHYQIFECEFKGDKGPLDAVTAQITTSFGQYITLIAQRTGITKAITKKRILGLHGVYCVPFDLYNDDEFRSQLRITE